MAQLDRKYVSTFSQEKKMKHTLLTILMLTSTIAFADTKADLQKIDDDMKVCLNNPDNQSNSGMKYCVGQAFDAADAKLNQVYKSIVANLKTKTNDDYTDKLNKESLNRLVASERAWVTFRDTNSDLYGVTMLGGTGESLEIVSEVYTMTAARIQELSDLLGN